MSRSQKKGPFVDEKLLKKTLKQKDTGDRAPIQTWARRSAIPPEFVGHKYNVHNGRKFLTVLVSEDMVGHCLGEFSPTRTFRGHSSKKLEASAPV